MSVLGTPVVEDYTVVYLLGIGIGALVLGAIVFAARADRRRRRNEPHLPEHALRRDPSDGRSDGAAGGR